jgi:hypothetical protein
VAAPAPAAAEPQPDPEAEQKRRRKKKAAQDLADAAMATQYGRMPSWLIGFLRIFRR